MTTIAGLRDLVLKYMDEYSNDGVVVPDADNADYLKKFFSFANKVNFEVAGLIKIPKIYTIYQRPLVNLLSSNNQVIDYIPKDGSITYETTEKAWSVYFELYGAGTVNVYGYDSGTWLLEKSYSNTSILDNQKVKVALIAYEIVKVEITGDYPCMVKNIAAYAEKFPIGEIPSWGAYRIYDMPADFMKMDKIADQDFRKYYSIGFRWADNSSLYIPVGFDGVYDIQYWANPTIITESTPTTTNLEQPDRVVNVMAYKIASLILTSSNEKPIVATRLLELYETELSRIIESVAVESNYIQNVYKFW